MAEIQPLDLNKQTAFILGAGASRPYGLPLGIELKDQMIRNLSNADCRKILTEHGFDRSLVEDFLESLRGTYHPTIDIFLEKKTNFRSLGAYLIAYTLLPLENHNNLFPQKDWYGHLYNVIDFEHDWPDTNNISFVSLNYDRSLEHFLTKNIQYNCPDHAIQNAKSQLECIEIIHAHGSLGPYPNISYGAQRTYSNVLRSAAEGIRIVSDRLEDSEDFRNAQFAINNASNLVFIGFGYDPTTLKLLMSSVHHLDQKRILGTAFKLIQSEISRLSEFFNGKIEIVNSSTTANIFVQNIMPQIPDIR